MKFVSVAAVIAGAALSSAALAQTEPPPRANPNASANPALKSPHALNATAPAAGHTSFTRAQAKGRIEQAGFTNIGPLHKTKQGLWYAEADQNGRHVQVVVDYQGDVTTQ
jgi:hypothetical protein